MIVSARIVCNDANPSQYHAQDAQRGTPEFVMSSSALVEFNRCPNRFVRGYNSPESDAKDWGALLDALFLTPSQIASRYAVQPLEYVNEEGETKKWNNNAKVCRQWVESQGRREVLSGKELERAAQAVAALKADETIKTFHADSDAQVWLAGTWKDDATGLLVPVRGLVDMLPRKDSEFCQCLGDLKTTRNAGVMPWQRWCYQAHYHWQAALYTDLFNVAAGDERNTFCFILQENFEPWQTAKRMLSQDFLTLGRAGYRAALANYCQCLKAGRWPGYDDTDEAVQGWSLVAPEPWMATAAQFAPKIEFNDDATTPAFEQDQNDVPTP